MERGRARRSQKMAWKRRKFDKVGESDVPRIRGGRMEGGRKKGETENG